MTVSTPIAPESCQIHGLFEHESGIVGHPSRWRSRPPCSLRTLRPLLIGPPQLTVYARDSRYLRDPARRIVVPLVGLPTLPRPPGRVRKPLMGRLSAD